MDGSAADRETDPAFPRRPFMGTYGIRCVHGRELRRCVPCGGKRQIPRKCEHKMERRICKKCNPNGHLRKCIRMHAFPYTKKNTVKLIDRYDSQLGCTPRQLRKYLEGLFKPGMSWDNRSEWQIDHRRPLASFDLYDKEQRRMCMHYTNIQPLWANENGIKGTAFDEATFDFEWTGSEWRKKP